MIREGTPKFQVLHHAIGAPKHQAELDGDPWRNRFWTDPTSDDGRVCESLVASGLMVRGRATVGGYTGYSATGAGIREVRGQLPALRRWIVETDAGADTVFAATRSKAKSIIIRAIIEAWNCTWREALGQIRSIKLAMTRERRAERGEG